MWINEGAKNRFPELITFTVRMKLSTILILSLAVAFLIIGIHQVMVNGFAQSYWILMIPLILYFVLNLRKKR